MGSVVHHVVYPVEFSAVRVMSGDDMCLEISVIAHQENTQSQNSDMPSK